MKAQASKKGGRGQAGEREERRVVGWGEEGREDGMTEGSRMEAKNA